MYCKYCGFQIDNDSIFCLYCGKDLKPQVHNISSQEISDQIASIKKSTKYGAIVRVGHGIDLTNTSDSIAESSPIKLAVEADLFPAGEPKEITKRVIPEMHQKSTYSFYLNFNKNVVNDPDAPKLYSRRVIAIFSILFSLLIGGIVFSINLWVVKKKRGIFPVLLITLLFTVLLIISNNKIGGNPYVGYFLNALGAPILYNYFWSKYIGKDFKYRTKPLWIILTIIIALLISFILWI
jgi:hypothetical protein